VLLGTSYGLWRSHNGGIDYESVPDLPSLSYALVRYHPNTSQTVWVGPSWYIKNPTKYPHRPQPVTGDRVAYVSHDGGLSFEAVAYTTGSGALQVRAVIRLGSCSIPS